MSAADKEHGSRKLLKSGHRRPLPLPLASSSYSYSSSGGTSSSSNKNQKGKSKKRNNSRNVAAPAAGSAYNGWESALGEEYAAEVAGEGEYNPRSFPANVKQACWEKAAKVKGRDPDRWRRDALGNIVFRKLTGCNGCLCHDYDHIIPYSKGGKSTLDNCQVLQAAANRAKGNNTDMSSLDLRQKSAYCRISGREMDFMELSAYGNVHGGQGIGGCKIQ